MLLVGAVRVDRPEVFDQNDDDGTVLLLQPEPAEELHDAVEDAADHCPCPAISLS